MNLKTQKLTFKSHFLNFLIWSGIIVGIFVVISELILSMITYKYPTSSMANDHNLWAPNGVWAGIWESLSTFSMQSILFVTIYFCFVLANQINPNRFKFVDGPISLAITLYATITMIVFWLILFKPSLDSLDINDAPKMAVFVDTFFLHLAMPLIAIFYYAVNAGSEEWTIKKTGLLSFPLTLGYMLVYLAYILVKGTCVGVVRNVKGNNIIDYSFPYNFLNYKASVGTFLMYFFAILIAFLALYGLYFFYNNWKNKQFNKLMAN